MKKLVMALGMVLTSLSWAGNGSSGGGNIYGDQLNPWFLQNTKTVTYCVEIAPEFGAISEERVLEIISDSFMYWKKIFASHESSDFAYGFKLEAKVATQEFVHVEKCSNDTDITFQMGFLTDEQKVKNSNYSQLLGLAQRTSYNEINLRGKGFIYIAPEEGELRPTSYNLHPKPWSHGRNGGLRMTLLHELGHIFGLQDHHYDDHGLMSALWVEKITSKDTLPVVSSLEGTNIPSPLGCNKDYDGSMAIGYMTDSIPPTEFSIQASDIGSYLGLGNRFTVQINTKNRIMEISIDGNAFGSITFKPYGQISGEINPAVKIYLSEKQQVFKGLPKEAFNRSIAIYHIAKSILARSEVLKLYDERSLDVFVEFNQDCLPTIGTVFNGNPIFDIFIGQ